MEINSENTGSFSEEMSRYFSELIFSAYANQSKKYIEIHKVFDDYSDDAEYTTLHSFIEMKKIMNKNDELIMDEKALITFKQNISSRLQDVYNQLGNLGIYLDLTTSSFKKIFIKIPQSTEEDPDFKITYFGNAKLDHDKFFNNFNDPAKLTESLKTDIKNLFPAASDFTKNKICRYFSDKPNIRKVEQVQNDPAKANQVQADLNNVQAKLLNSVEKLNTNREVAETTAAKTNKAVSGSESESVKPLVEGGLVNTKADQKSQEEAEPAGPGPGTETLNLGGPGPGETEFNWRQNNSGIWKSKKQREEEEAEKAAAEKAAAEEPAANGTGPG